MTSEERKPIDSWMDALHAMRDDPIERALTTRVENVGLYVGMIVFAVAAILIYLFWHYLARRLGETAAEIILAVPAFFAIFIVLPVRDLFARFALRRYCSRNGHILSQFVSYKGQRVVTCQRCSTMLRGAVKKRI
jgi:hypothetical protein